MPITHNQNTEGKEGKATKTQSRRPIAQYAARESKTKASMAMRMENKTKPREGHTDGGTNKSASPTKSKAMSIV